MFQIQILILLCYIYYCNFNLYKKIYHIFCFLVFQTVMFRRSRLCIVTVTDTVISNMHNAVSYG